MGANAAVWIVSLILASAALGQPADSLYSRGAAMLQQGEYDEARALLGILMERQPGHEGVLDLVRTYTLVGEYQAGLDAIDDLIPRDADAPRLYQARGRLLAELGRYEEAEAAYREALGLQGDLWTCGIDIADLFARTGRDRQAQSVYATVYQQYELGTFRTVETLWAGGRAAAEIGEFRDANEAFRTAFRIDGQDVRTLYTWAELFRVKYNDADASRTFEDALRVNARHAPSLIGLARITGSFERKEELAQQALEINPNLVDALAVMAGLRILDGQYGEAAEVAHQALDVNPSSVAAMGQLASAHHLRGDTASYHEIERRALAVDAEGSDFYLTLAENAALRFRYEDAATFARQAVEVNRRDLQARAELGTALLRLGRRTEARRYLESAFDGDPFNLYASNMLTLLDSYESFSMLESEHFRLLIPDAERDVLGAEMLELAEASFDSLRARYPYDPSDKILIEAYDDADDFAVRIAGIPHRGLLGVSFGDVVAVNTPRAQSGSAYNWARTLWHEIAHTMAMGVSRNHVPRWFTEGLSVYEEQRARPEWGREMDLGFFSALERDMLLPLDDIDRGFTRPSFPGQIQLSYYHAGKMVTFLADTYGFDAIVDILTGLSEGQTDAAAVASATGMPVEDVDAAFREAMEREADAARHALEGLPDVLENEDAEITAESISAARGPFFDRLRAARESFEAGAYDEAESAYREAMSMYGSYTGPGNAYEGLAAVYRERGDREGLERVLTDFLAIAEHETDAAIELAGILAETDRDAAAATMLERVLHVNPYDVDTQERLAELYEESGRYAEAVAHRRAVVALDPPDLAGAYFALARSLERTGRSVEAKRAVLQSLEVATDFREAQRLLLDIVE